MECAEASLMDVSEVRRGKGKGRGKGMERKGRDGVGLCNKPSDWGSTTNRINRYLGSCQCSLHKLVFRLHHKRFMLISINTP